MNPPSNRRPAIWLLVGATALFMVGALVVDFMQEPGGESLSDNEPPDPEMQAAMRQARDTFPEFLASFRQPSLAQSFFSVKVPYQHRGITKHVWLTDLSVEDGRIHGLVERGAKSVPVMGSVTNISDWMIIDDGVLRGGYTTRLLRRRMPEAERLRFDQGAGFRLGP